MCENVFKGLLGEMMESELAKFDNAPDWKPSLRHRLAMKRIFARYERNVQKLKGKERITGVEPSSLNFKQRIFLALVIVLLMILLVGWVNVFVSKDFHGIVYADNTHLFAVNTENAPASIEYKYSLNYVPEGFELVETDDISPSNVYMLYKNSLTGQTITFSQWVKSHFKPHINTEYSKLREIDINGISGLCIDMSKGDYDKTLLLWDNKDYIIEISADLDKASTIDLLEINKYNFLC